MAPRELQLPGTRPTAQLRRNAVDEVRIPPAGDGFYAAGRRTETELVEAIAEEESRLGRSMTPSEREEFARRFFAPEYRQEQRGLEIRDLMAALGFGEAEEDEG
jgi:hypothetical protein